MFTGLVQTTGNVETRAARGPGFRLGIRADLGQLELGESISVSGVCLTVAEVLEGRFEADLSIETSRRTTLGRLALGNVVNLERALCLTDRLGGHLVSGHVDAVIQVHKVTQAGEARRVDVSLPADLRGLVAPKGSVALDGVSLTVNECADDEFSLMLIPQTLALTTLTALRPGQELNLEVDMLARYVARWLEVGGRGESGRSDAAERDRRLRAALERGGWT